MNWQHQTQPVLSLGAPLERAKAAMILIHGRGASAESILTLTSEFDAPDLAYLAPQADGYTWYPNSFLAPVASNEPGITNGMQTIDNLMAHLAEHGLSSEQVILLGFSQGACLSLEYAARHAKRYAGVVALSGGLIGADDTPRDYVGSLAETPVFLGCSDVDFHIPVGRVHESAEIMANLGGAVTKRIYPNMGHTVNQDELDFVRELLQSLSA